MKIKKLLKCPDKETENNQTKLVDELPIQTGLSVYKVFTLFKQFSTKFHLRHERLQKILS